MAKQDEIMIPTNFKTKFEFMPNLGIKDTLFFIPSIITIVLMIWLVPVSPIFIFVFALFSLFIPFCMVFIRPVKNTIPGWKHILYAIRFNQRQKVFYYRKKV